MTTSGLASMAWRNLWRHRRRTLITLSSIALGTMLAVIFTGLGDSNFSGMIDIAARMGGGHVTLEHAEFRDTPTLGRTLRDVARLRERALEDPEVVRAVTRISGPMMIASAGQSYGAYFIAFDPANEDTSTLSLLEALSEGRMFTSEEPRGIVLGAVLAENLDVSLGKKVVLSLSDRDGEIVQEAARVLGIVRSGAPSVDQGLCLLSLQRMSEVLGYAPDEALQVGLFLSDQRSAEVVAERLSGLMPQGVATLSWQQIQPELAGFISMKVASGQFMELIIMVLVAAGIFNTLFVGVMERLREFGIMLAIGFSPARLFALVMCESLWLGLVGLVAAAIVTAAPYHYLATTGLDVSAQIGEGGAEVAGVAVSPIMYVGIYPENLVMICLFALAATLASGVWPAWRAGAVEPVESIRLV